jgi:hypothetical protein
MKRDVVLSANVLGNNILMSLKIVWTQCFFILKNGRAMTEDKLLEFHFNKEVEKIRGNQRLLDWHKSLGTVRGSSFATDKTSDGRTVALEIINGGTQMRVTIAATAALEPGCNRKYGKSFLKDLPEDLKRICSGTT